MVHSCLFYLLHVNGYKGDYMNDVIDFIEDPVIDHAQYAQSNRAKLIIDLSAITHNLNYIKTIAPKSKIMGVVKGNAYGLGVLPIAKHLDLIGVDGFAVDNVYEGIGLRKIVKNKPIMIIDGDLSENCDIALSYNLIPGIPHESLLRYYNLAAKKKNSIFPVWLMVNVGFNRSGYKLSNNLIQFFETAKQCQYLYIDTLYAHLTNSNDLSGVTEEQIQSFLEATKIIRKIFNRNIKTSLFASHGLLGWGDLFHTDWVRPGIVLYGENQYINHISSSKINNRIAHLKSAIELKARIIHTLCFVEEDRVGYGLKYKTYQGQKLATLSYGFGRGYPLNTSKAYVLYQDQPCQVFGDVGMDAMQIDVSHINNKINLYDWVTLIGKNKSQKLTASQLAKLTKISTYNLLSNLQCAKEYLN